MTIDKDSFLAGLSVLAGNFGREIDPAVTRAYYSVLSPLMTTDDFQRAVEMVMVSETFWPSTAVILSKVKADAESRAHLAFERVNRVLGQHGGYRYLPFAVYSAEFDAPTRQAITVVGGLAAICNTPEERWSGLQKRFVAAYQQALQPQLPAPTVDPKVKQLVRQTAANLSSGRDRAAGVEP